VVPVVKHQHYTVASDNSGHEYIIPVEHLDEWNAWAELDEDDERSWDAPEWAERLAGGRLTFSDWSIG
jgi:hypothetical protein